MRDLRAGTASIIIDPPVGVDLCGYAGRPSGCTDVHDDLYAKALVISDGETRAAIISLDILGLAAEHAAAIRAKVESATGIPAGNVLIGASHTHSGPATQFLRACGEVCDCYLNDLIERVAGTVVRASTSMTAARFGLGAESVDVSINRRQDGGIKDCGVGVWYFTSEDGTSLATVFNYACHAVVMGGDNLLVSADWPGAAQRAIEAGLGGQAMFLQGCCGNINPRDRGDFDAAMRTGTEVAGAVLMAVEKIEPGSDVRLSVKSETIQLPLQPPPSREALEAVIGEMEESLSKADDSTPLALIQLWTAYRDWARRLIETDEHPTHVPFEVQRLSLGDAHIIALPGEVFVEYALNIKAMAPDVMVVGYANGNVGYVPTSEAFAEGGYEVEDAYRLYGERMLSPEAQAVILQTARRLLTR